jgi:protein-S-isoprenylcysteine O-methyltransferase Ste14
MISAVAALLFGQAFLFSSPVVGVWALAFSAINALYIPLVEEPALAKRFGKAYLTYQQHVPRWLPRLSPWQLLEKHD